MPAGRPKEFDEDEALENAMHTFWQRGYQRTSLSDLSDSMGIGRQSIYDTFTDKRGLFLRALLHYRDNHLSSLLLQLEEPGSPLGNLKKVLRFFEERAAHGDFRGCLAANTLVEIANTDPELEEVLSRILQTLEKSFRKAIVSASDAGELSSERDPARMAKALTNNFVGMAVTSKLSPDETSVRAMFSASIEMLH